MFKDLESQSQQREHSESKPASAWHYDRLDSKAKQKYKDAGSQHQLNTTSVPQKDLEVIKTCFSKH